MRCPQCNPPTPPIEFSWRARLKALGEVRVIEVPPEALEAPLNPNPATGFVALGIELTGCRHTVWTHRWFARGTSAVTILEELAKELLRKVGEP